MEFHRSMIVEATRRQNYKDQDTRKKKGTRLKKTKKWIEITLRFPPNKVKGANWEWKGWNKQETKQVETKEKKREGSNAMYYIQCCVKLQNTSKYIEE